MGATCQSWFVAPVTKNVAELTEPLHFLVHSAIGYTFGHALILLIYYAHSASGVAAQGL